MARNAKKSAQKNNNLSMIESLETRSLMSATPTVMAYLPDYEMTPGMTALLQSSKFEGLTQINYFSITPDAQGTLPGTTLNNGHSNASTTTSSGYQIDNQLNPLITAAHNASVKVSVVIGGAADASNTLTQVIEGGQDAWNNLAGSINSFAQTHNIDGVDLDWEPSGATADDISNYGQLIDTIKNSTHGLSLSAAVSAEPLWLAPSYSTTSYVLNSTAIADLNQINVMSYDLGKPGDGAPIAQAETDMQNWVTNAHAPASKLVMGLPFYGRATTLTASQMSDDNPWANSTDSNTSTAAYGAIVAAASGNVSTSTSSSANLSIKEVVPSTFNGKNSKATWNFDGPGTIQAKTNFALNNHFGGVMIWSLGSDSFDVTSTDNDGNALAETFNAHSLLPVVKNAVDAFNASNAPTTPTTPTAPVNTTPTQLTGTPIGTSGSWGNQGNTIANVFDGKLNTFFDAPNAGSASSPDWVGLDLGSQKTLSQIKFTARAGYEYRMEGGVFQGSNTADFSNNVNLFTVGNTVAPSSTSLTAVTVSGTFRYVRFLAPAGAYGNIAEMQVFGSTPVAAQNQALAAVFSSTTIGSNDDQQNN